MGSKFHLKLNNGERPIANKYREGKMKRTFKRELKVLEIAKREALGDTSASRRSTLVCLPGCRRLLCVSLQAAVFWVAAG